MTAVAGHVLIHDGESGAPLPEEWTGICVDGSDTNKFWLIGHADGERTFNRLKACDMEAACSEVASLVAGLEEDELGQQAAERQR